MQIVKYIYDIDYVNYEINPSKSTSKTIFAINIPCKELFYAIDKNNKINGYLKTFGNVKLYRRAVNSNRVELDICINSVTTKHLTDKHDVNAAIDVLKLKTYKTLYKFVITILEYCKSKYDLEYDEEGMGSGYWDIVQKLEELKK